MANERVTIVVRLRDAASRGLDKIKQKFRGLRVSARGLATAVGAVGAAIAGGVVALGRFAERGGKVLGVQRSFARVTGDVSGALGTLQRSTRGLIADYDLMAGLNRAIALGSARNVTEFGELSEAAIALGRALGVDAAFALESLNLGIGRQSRLILDNLGLVVSAEKANRDYAEAIDTSADALTDAQRKEAFRLEALEQARAKVEELGGVTETAADSWVRLTTAISNAKDELAKFIAQSDTAREFFEEATFLLQRGQGRDPVAEARAASAQGVGNLDQAILQTQRLADGFQLALRRFEEDPSESNRQALEARRTELAAFQRRVMALATQGAGGTGGGDGAGDGAEPTEAEARKAAAELKALGAAAGDAALKLKTMEGEIKAPGERGGRAGAIAGIMDPSLLRDKSGDPRSLGMGFTGQGVSGVRDIVGLGPTDQITLGIKRRAHELNEQGQEFDQAAQTAVAALGVMGQAAVENSQLTAQSVIGMFNDILQSIKGVGGTLVGSFIGAGLGIIGSLFAKDSHPTPVRVEDYSSTAERKMNQRTGPERVQVLVVTPEGVKLADVEHDLNRRSRRDASPRIPAGVRLSDG